LDKHGLRVSSFFADCPFPIWIKNPSLEYIYTNNAFINAIDYDVISLTDFDIWPDDVANNLHEGDIKVLNENIKWSSRTDLMFGNETVNCVIIRWPLLDLNARILGIAGMIIRHDDSNFILQ